MGKLTVTQTDIPDVLIIDPFIYIDERGFFVEWYNYRDFSDFGIVNSFIQDNHSKSQKGVLRGLHYQYPHPQTKLVRVICGAIYDVAVDIRVGSPTYGKYVGVLLTAEKSSMLYIPKGFAHGFLVLKDDTEVQYKVDDYYYPEGDAGILWSDPDISISWPMDKIGGNEPIISSKDLSNPCLCNLHSPFKWQNQKEQET